MTNRELRSERQAKFPRRLLPGSVCAGSHLCPRESAPAPQEPHDPSQGAGSPVLQAPLSCSFHFGASLHPPVCFLLLTPWSGLATGPERGRLGFRSQGRACGSGSTVPTSHASQRAARTQDVGGAGHSTRQGRPPQAPVAPVPVWSPWCRLLPGFFPRKHCPRLRCRGASGKGAEHKGLLGGLSVDTHKERVARGRGWVMSVLTMQ